VVVGFGVNLTEKNKGWDQVGEEGEGSFDQNREDSAAAHPRTGSPGKTATGWKKRRRSKGERWK